MLLGTRGRILQVQEEDMNAQKKGTIILTGNQLHGG